jgi:hypothetical protein
MKLKKHAIGYNTVSSVNGVVNARGVKSKPNNMEIYGYTHEVGEGEKSPDNPYILESLDSGAMSVDGVEYEHSIKLINSGKAIQVPTPIPLNSVEGISDRIIKKEDIYYVEQNIQDIIVDKISSVREQQNGYTKSNINIENGKVTKANKIVCDKLLSKNIWLDIFTLEYIRNSGSAYPNLVVAYMSTSRFTTNDTATENEILAYLKDNPIRILYQVENPYYLKLSDYAQELLNSFTLQNNNKIWIEGYPDIKVGGYLQMR